MTKSQLIQALEGREVETKASRRTKAGRWKVKDGRLEITEGLGENSHPLVNYHIARLEIFLRNSREANE